ncbi:MAG: lipopolysaccharide kinase InaA family protein [Pseudomonas sp.]
MHKLTIEELQNLTNNSTVIEHDGLGPKVLKLTDGSFLKLFRKRKALSSETLKPYAIRFAENAERLRELGFSSPQIIDTYKLSGSINRTAVHYLPLPGTTLRQALKTATPEQRQQLVFQFGELLSKFHQRGIYFRSLHLGNVLVLPDQQLGLIDLADMRIGNRPLSINKRRRNLKHLKRYTEDCHWLFTENRSALQAGYQTHASPKAQEMLSAYN